ncbi:ABC transporter transmembrane domain-containing protein [Burkholderia sp. 9120]|uniref:ABC transporter transmembrane domain-containing protein n=1 Tax=Burkholderia sp. 9120 TaxID=1500897 RepID=UPI000A545609|nr:ABC transporter transmembrane domain-containing protein [Burkholderia sp. 9120]
MSPERLSRTPFPALAFGHDGKHFILAGSDGETVLVLEPNAQATVVRSREEVSERSNGRLMLFASRASLAGELARFDFSWFIPAVVKYRRLLLEVLFVSLILQLFGLVSPLMFQVVMDKVLTNRAYDTLNVVCIALLVSSVFEILLTGLRNYIFSHTTNRIDVELGARLFRHLFALPLAYFGARRVGDTVARVRELENIRNFLTGQALTAVIDLTFSVIFLAVMCMYSVWLTLIVAVSLPIYAAISAGLNPILRGRLNEKFARGADNQSFLVEAVSSFETVKSMAVEPQFVRRWEGQLAAYVAAGFRVSSLGNVGQQLIQLVGKFVTLGIHRTERNRSGQSTRQCGHYMGNKCSGSWKMKLALTDRQKEIVSNLRVKDAGKNTATFDSLDAGEMTFAEIDVICGLINAEFMMEGILPTFEPNEYGLELERLLDLINRPRLRT